jgi:hypothetical protein
MMVLVMVGMVACGDDDTKETNQAGSEAEGGVAGGEDTPDQGGEAGMDTQGGAAGEGGTPEGMSESSSCDAICEAAEVIFARCFEGEEPLTFTDEERAECLSGCDELSADDKSMLEACVAEDLSCEDFESNCSVDAESSI